MLSHSHLERARWGAMEIIPGVIFILTPLSLSLSIPLSLPIYVFLSLCRLFSLLHTHSLTGSEISMFVFFNEKKKRRKKCWCHTEHHRAWFNFFLPGDTVSQICCHSFCFGIWTNKNCEIWSLIFQNICLLCASVWECVGVLACVKKTYYIQLMIHCIDALNIVMYSFMLINIVNVNGTMEMPQFQPSRFSLFT